MFYVALNLFDEPKLKTNNYNIAIRYAIKHELHVILVTKPLNRPYNIRKEIVY